MRPKGFKNPYSDFISGNPQRLHKSFNGNEGCVTLGFVKDLEAWAFEAGADEYERCLKKEGQYEKWCLETPIEASEDGVKGWLVFIGEE